MSIDGLSGLTVLEVAGTLGAAFAGSLLAVYNAAVIVCEPPEGSALRRLGPDKLSDKARWKILARNKKSVAADWNDPANAPLIRRLLTHADLLVVDTAWPRYRQSSPWFPAMLETMAPAERPLVVEVFPTGADRPDLWPWSTRPEFAGAASGVMALTGHTGQTPIHAEAPLTDYLAGTLAATKALIALRKARLTKTVPGTVSTPLHQAVQRMIEWQTPVATVKGRAETRMANNFPMNAGIANMHPTGEGKYVAISAVTQATRRCPADEHGRRPDLKRRPALRHRRGAVERAGRSLCPDRRLDRRADDAADFGDRSRTGRGAGPDLHHRRHSRRQADRCAR